MITHVYSEMERILKERCGRGFARTVYEDHIYRVYHYRAIALLFRISQTFCVIAYTVMLADSNISGIG